MIQRLRDSERKLLLLFDTNRRGRASILFEATYRSYLHVFVACIEFPRKFPGNRNPYLYALS